MDDYEFVLWDSEADRLTKELEDQEMDFQEEFFSFVQKTARFGWLRTERIETLEDRFETYAFSILGKQPLAMLTRPTDGNRYTYLGLASENDAREAVYHAACQAHDLTDPRRTP